MRPFSLAHSVQFHTYSTVQANIMLLPISTAGCPCHPGRFQLSNRFSFKLGPWAYMTYEVPVLLLLMGQVCLVGRQLSL